MPISLILQSLFDPLNKWINDVHSVIKYDMVSSSELMENDSGCKRFFSNRKRDTKSNEFLLQKDLIRFLKMMKDRYGSY